MVSRYLKSHIDEEENVCLPEYLCSKYDVEQVNVIKASSQLLFVVCSSKISLSNISSKPLQ